MTNPETDINPTIDPVGGQAPAAASFSDLGQGAPSGGSAPLNALLDVALPITIEFGRTEMLVQDVLELTDGSVIQLDRMVGEPVDILVSDRKLAEGEVVVIGEYFGVRITRLVSNPAGGVAAA